jgi:hypothetical protein
MPPLAYKIVKTGDLAELETRESGGGGPAIKSDRKLLDTAGKLIIRFIRQRLFADNRIGGL